MIIESEMAFDVKLPLQGLSELEMRAIASEVALRLGWFLSDEEPSVLMVLTSANTVSPDACDLLSVLFNEERGEVVIRNGELASPDVDESVKGQIRADMERLRGGILELRERLTPGELAGMVTALEEISDMTAVEEAKEDTGEDPPFYTFLIPRKAYRATPILMYINVLVFLLMVIDGTGIFEPQSLKLLDWGADFGPLTLTGDMWRTLTCNFVHIGIFHILMNMYAFLYIGFLLEPLLSARRIFISYLLTGVCSALCSLFWHGETISAGASGAIFGLYGVFLSLLLFRCLPRHKQKALLASILVFVGYNLLNGMKDGIDNAAHIGGLISGLVLGAIYAYGIKHSQRQSAGLLSSLGEFCMLLVYLAGFISLTKNIPEDYHVFRQEWDNGIIQSQLDGEETVVPDNDNLQGTPIMSKDQLPPYIPFRDTDAWVGFDSEKGQVHLRYPSNWQTYETTSAEYPDILFQQRWFNASNYLVLTVCRYDTDEEFARNKELTLSIPRDGDGNPSKEYARDVLHIDGNEFVKTENQQHFGAPTEEGYEMSQSVLKHFSEKDRMIYAFVMLINEDEAKKDLDAIMESVRFSYPGTK